MDFHKKYLQIKPLKELIEESVSGGWITECFYFMKRFIKSKDKNTIAETILDEIVILESRFNDLNRRKNRGTIELTKFTLERNRIIEGILDLRKLISQYFPDSQSDIKNEAQNEFENDKHIVTLTTNYDFDTISDSDKNKLIDKLLNIFSTCPDQFIFKNIKRGSIKIDISTSLKQFINLKILLRIGFLDELQVDSVNLNNVILEKIIEKHIMKRFYEESLNKAYVIESLNFDNFDLSAKKVKCLKFYNCSFQNVNFNGSTLSTVLFEKTKFNLANFSDSEILNSRFVKINLSKVDFNKAFIQESSFYKSDLKDASFQNSKIINSFIYSSKLVNADFTSAKLEKTIFNPLDQKYIRTVYGLSDYLKGVNTDKSYLRLDTVNFTKAYLNKVSFISIEEQFLSNLKDAHIEQLVFENMIITEDFSNKNIDSFRFNNCEIVSSKFINSSLRMAEITNCIVRNTVFNEANLLGSNLNSSTFIKSSFDETNFEDSSLLKIDIDDFSRLKRSYLMSTKFSKSIESTLINTGIDVSNIIFVDDDNKGGGNFGPSGTGPKTPTPTPTPINPIVPDPVI